MDYKVLIKNQETRLKILKLLNFVPDKTMIKWQYRIKFNRKLNLSSPKRFSEKLQWYKLYYRDSLMTIASDKYNVRQYVKSKGLKDILNELYAVYENVEEINFDSLPEKFVMKTTNGSGTNIFSTDKSKLSIYKVKNDLEMWLSRDVFSSGREWSYKDIKPRIIAEKLLESKNSQFEGINDYKFLCFNGKPEYIVLDVDRHIEHKRNIYDINWNLIDVSTDRPNIKEEVERPEALDEMLEISRILSEDFPFVRVDLYYVNKKIYFGELTFYPWTGYIQFNPDNFDFLLGKKFIINKMMF